MQDRRAPSRAAGRFSLANGVANAPTIHGITAFRQPKNAVRARGDVSNLTGREPYLTGF